MEEQMFHSKSVDFVFQALHSRADGLMPSEAKKRLSQGANVLPSPSRPSGWSILFSQFTGSLTIVLIVAGFASWFLGEYADAIIICFTVLITALFGFIQEFRAEQAFRLLQSMLALRARVIRGGVEREIDMHDVVVGDVVVLSAGARVPADARLFEVSDLTVIESELTGESVPKEKHIEVVDRDASLADLNNMVFQGTIIASGEGKALVCATGSHTEFARIAQSIDDVEVIETPLQRDLASFVRWLTMIIGVMIVILFAVSMMKGVGIVLAVQTAIAVAVGSIPEGLVISVTAMLALGAQQMLASHVLIRNLLAVETLGAVSVICTDKTGTLTQGNMQVVDFGGEGDELAKAVYYGSGIRVGGKGNNSKKWKLFGSPTEQALFSWAVKQVAFPVNLAREKQRLDRLDVLPFSSLYKFSATLYKEGKQHVAYVVGAPEKILKFATARERRTWKKKIDVWAGEGKRVIGVASGVVSKKTLGDDNDVLSLPLVFLGVCVIADPIRESVLSAIQQAQRAGVRVVMITGDNSQTALSVAREAGIDVQKDSVIDSVKMKSMSDAQLKQVVRTTAVFARITPLDKLRIVKALQMQKFVVAMTGDGINDAAALKRADIGVAVGTAHDIAKQSAGMVILDNDFASIVRAIASGRRIYANVQKVVTFLLYGAFTSAVVIVCSLLFGLPLPYLPAQILWVNIIEDIMPGLAFVFEPAEEDQMKQGPRNKKSSFISPVSKGIIFGAGLLSSFLSFIVFWLVWHFTNDLLYARTIAFVILGVDTFFTAFALKSLSKPVWRINPLNNLVLVFSLFGSYMLYFVALYVPFFQALLGVVSLDAVAWTIIFIEGLCNLAMVEVVKYVYNKRGAV